MPVDNISIMYSAWGAAETRAHPGQVACGAQDNLSCLQTTKPRDNFGITLEQIGDNLSCLRTTKPLATLG